MLICLKKQDCFVFLSTETFGTLGQSQKMLDWEPKSDSTTRFSFCWMNFGNFSLQVCWNYEAQYWGPMIHKPQHWDPEIQNSIHNSGSMDGTSPYVSCLIFLSLTFAPLLTFLIDDQNLPWVFLWGIPVSTRYIPNKNNWTPTRINTLTPTLAVLHNKPILADASSWGRR